LISVYQKGEANENIESLIQKYKEAVNQYYILVSVQPWKTLASVFKVAPSQLIS
jgi:hypothetical protein